MTVEIRVPVLGESVSEATIGRWFKQAGDAVAQDEPILELETDKVTLEVNAPAAGVLSEITVKDGETVTPGALLGAISEGAAPAKPQAHRGAFSGTCRKAGRCGKILCPRAVARRRQDRRRSGDRYGRCLGFRQAGPGVEG